MLAINYLVPCIEQGGHVLTSSYKILLCIGFLSLRFFSVCLMQGGGHIMSGVIKVIKGATRQRK